MQYKGVARGRIIELEEPLPYEEGQIVSVFVEPLDQQPKRGSPAAVLQAMREPPHVSWEDVDALERAIEESQLPVSDEGIFDEDDMR